MKPHGTHAAHNRHKKRGEQPCDACIAGERDYQRHRHLRRTGQCDQVDGQRPLLASTSWRGESVTAPPAHGLMAPPEFITGDYVRRVSRALLNAPAGVVVSYTREHGLRLHVDPDIADDWITAAPMADDEPLAEVCHLPVGRTA